MADFSAVLLVASVAAVGVLHTMVPDHWLPIALLARQRGWTRGETMRAALQAGVGHVVTTLLIGLVVWAVGATAAARFGSVVDLLASAALVLFGLWIAFGAWRELREEDDEHRHAHDEHHHTHPHADHDHGTGHGHHHHHHVEAEPWTRDALYAPAASVLVAERHVHWHTHDGGPPHRHWHDHAVETAHALDGDAADAAPPHVHRHGVAGRTALLLVLGSSPMIEGIPAFFAAARYGVDLLVVMSLVFAASTIATYVVLCAWAAGGLQRLRLGAFERYGEVASGLLIAAVGVAFGLIAR